MRTSNSYDFIRQKLQKKAVPSMRYDGKEDFAKSRRVELELVVKSSNLQDFMGLGKNESVK